MIRVYVICEGLTEETFVKGILKDSMTSKHVCLIPSLIGKPGKKGGDVRFERVLRDIRYLLNDSEAYCTTFLDFYGLSGDFPGRQDALVKKGARNKAECFLTVFTARLAEELGENIIRRFIPYIQMYEFEGLLFSHPEKLAISLGKTTHVKILQRIRSDFSSPEDINNSPQTAPSKRLKNLFPCYNKSLNGSVAAAEIGLAVIRQECPLFNEWLEKIESLAFV